MGDFMIKGLDKIQDELKAMEEKAKELSGEQEVSFEELFTHEFMLKNTRYNTLDELFQAADLNIETNEDFDNLPQEELDAGIQKVTKFKSWKDFIGEAATNYFAKRMGF